MGKLLSEEQIRRMHRLAKLDKYSEDFINENKDMDMGDDLDEMETPSMDKVDHDHPDHEFKTGTGKGPGPGGHEFKNASPSKRNHLEEGAYGRDEDMMDTDPMGDDMDSMEDLADDPMDDMGGMDDMGEDPGMEATESDVTALVSALADAIEAETGIAVDVASDAGSMEGPMDDMGDMGDEMPEEPMGDEMPEEPMGDEEPDMEEAGPRLKGATREMPAESKQRAIDALAESVVAELKRRSKQNKK